jgi:hypothetical protein
MVELLALLLLASWCLIYSMICCSAASSSWWNCLWWVLASYVFFLFLSSYPGRFCRWSARVCWWKSFYTIQYPASLVDSTTMSLRWLSPGLCVLWDMQLSLWAACVLHRLGLGPLAWHPGSVWVILSIWSYLLTCQVVLPLGIIPIFLSLLSSYAGLRKWSRSSIKWCPRKSWRFSYLV